MGLSLQSPKDLECVARNNLSSAHVPVADATPVKINNIQIIQLLHKNVCNKLQPSKNRSETMLLLLPDSERLFVLVLAVWFYGAELSFMRFLERQRQPATIKYLSFNYTYE